MTNVSSGGATDPHEGAGRDELFLDLGASLDAVLGFSPAETYILLVVDPAAGGVQAYGPYPKHAVHDEATAMRDQFRNDGIEGVSVHVLPLHRPGS